MTLISHKTTDKEDSSNSYLSKLALLFFGEMNELKLNEKIYISASFVAFTSTILGFIWNYIIDLALFLNLIVGAIMVAYIILYYLARFKKEYYPTMMFIVSQFGLALTWISSAGINGSVLPFFLVSIAPLLSISKPSLHIKYLLINLLNISILLFIQKSKYNYIIIQYPDNFTGELDILFSFIFSLILTYAYIHLLILGYNKENDTVSTQKEELENLNASKDKFFSIIAHDLRGPFTGITELTRLMADESMNLSKEELQSLSKKVSQSANSTYGLLENLLSYARVNQGLIQYLPEDISLKLFASTYLEALKDFAENKSIRTENKIDNSIMVNADIFMLQTILRNLIMNAIKFTPAGGEIYIDARKIDNNFIEVIVGDNGIGMNPSILENIFNMGKQIRRTGTENEASSGLGLLLVKEFVNQHNGSVSVESTEGKGSIFKFTIPQK